MAKPAMMNEITNHISKYAYVVLRAKQLRYWDALLKVSFGFIDAPYNETVISVQSTLDTINSAIACNALADLGISREDADWIKAALEEVSEMDVDMLFVVHPSVKPQNTVIKFTMPDGRQTSIRSFDLPYLVDALEHLVVALEDQWAAYQEGSSAWDMLANMGLRKEWEYVED